MNKTLSIRLLPYRLLVRGITFWLINTCVLSGLISPCQAQTNRSYQEGQAHNNPWRDPYEPRQTYLLHVEALQHQIKCLLKPLSRLSVTDPPAYSLLQDNLHTYLRQLEQEGTDYEDSKIYQAVQLQLIRFEERVKVALAESRRIAQEAEPKPDKFEKVTKGVKVTVRPYALVFNKPDYRSALRHIILPKETVTVLKDEGTYCQVKCALHKGYLSKGMIISYTP